VDNVQPEFIMATVQKDSAYRLFWNKVGITFHSLKGAASTDYYFECECILHKQFFPALKDLLLLKTDLWDEAKNSEILYWAAEQGARPFGIDIAFEIVQQAREVLRRHHPGCVTADLRSLPFHEHTFDLIYSMGTIEHFHDSDIALHEMFRVLKPQGCAIIGVPNKLDPFLRPLLVSFLNHLNLYAYGMEKSFTSRRLRHLLESAGFLVTAHTGILFMPGWLRMADLLCHTRFPRLSWITGAFIKPFAWAYRYLPFVRKHGYLIACVVTKPGKGG
jgi:SAM-dependent methyltransferase